MHDGPVTPYPALAQGASQPPGQPPEAADEALSLLKALADPLRLRVIQALGQGERCVCDLTSELHLAQSRLSFHLRVLRQAGLISAREQGRWVYYRLRPEALQQIAQWLLELDVNSQVKSRPCD